MRRLRLPTLCAALAAPLVLASCGLPIAASDCLHVQGTADARAPGYIVAYLDGVPVQPTTDQLAARYHFTPTFVFAAPPGFSADLDDAALDGLRCETNLIKRIEHNAVAVGGGT